MIHNFSKDLGIIADNQHCQYSAHVTWIFPKNYSPLFDLHQNLNDSDKLNVIYLILKDLQILHMHKTVHGNLNPRTVFLNTRNPCHVYLTCYGLSKISSSLSKQQLAYQTFEGSIYPDFKSDIYSLSKIIELLSVNSTYRDFFSKLNRCLLTKDLKSALDIFKNPPCPIKVLHSFSSILSSKLPQNEFNDVYQYVLNEAQKNNSAQLFLGLKFRFGLNPYIPINREEAMRYFRAAMKNGNLKAKFFLAQMLSQEQEQSKRSESFQLFKELDSQHYFGTSYNLGLLHQKAGQNQDAIIFFNKEFENIDNRGFQYNILLKLCKAFLSNDIRNIPYAEQCLQKYYENIQFLKKIRKNKGKCDSMLKNYNIQLKRIKRLKSGGMITSESDLSDDFSDDSEDFSSDSEEF